MKRHSHPFSIPEHGSKTGANSNFEGSPVAEGKISKRNSMYTKEMGKMGKKRDKDKKAGHRLKGSPEYRK
jgi:hypothetical protein